MTLSSATLAELRISRAPGFPSLLVVTRRDDHVLYFEVLGPFTCARSMEREQGYLSKRSGFLQVGNNGHVTVILHAFAGCVRAGTIRKPAGWSISMPSVRRLVRLVCKRQSVLRRNFRLDADRRQRSAQPVDQLESRPPRATIAGGCHVFAQVRVGCDQVHVGSSRSSFDRRSNGSRTAADNHDVHFITERYSTCGLIDQRLGVRVETRPATRSNREGRRKRARTWNPVAERDLMVGSFRKEVFVEHSLCAEPNRKGITRSLLAVNGLPTA